MNIIEPNYTKLFNICQHILTYSVKVICVLFSVQQVRIWNYVIKIIKCRMTSWRKDLIGIFVKNFITRECYVPSYSKLLRDICLAALLHIIKIYCKKQCHEQSSGWHFCCVWICAFLDCLPISTNNFTLSLRFYKSYWSLWCMNQHLRNGFFILSFPFLLLLLQKLKYFKALPWLVAFVGS